MATNSTTIARTAIHAPCCTLVANTTTSTIAVKTAPTALIAWERRIARRSPPPSPALTPPPAVPGRPCKARCQWRGQQQDPVGEHQPVAPVVQLPGQVAVSGQGRRQPGEAVERGVGGEDEDRRGRGLEQVEQSGSTIPGPIPARGHREPPWVINISRWSVRRHRPIASSGVFECVVVQGAAAGFALQFSWCPRWGASGGDRKATFSRTQGMTGVPIPRLTSGGLELVGYLIRSPLP